jgi:hypothetical protein
MLCASSYRSVTLDYSLVRVQLVVFAKKKEDKGVSELLFQSSAFSLLPRYSWAEGLGEGGERSDQAKPSRAELNRPIMV